MKEISKGYENINVEIIDYCKDFAKHIWEVNRMTWKKYQNIPYAYDNKLCLDIIRDVVNKKALPVAKEQCIITFRINNISRVCLAQLTRQHESRFNVESQMPEPVEHNVILPLNIAQSGFENEAKELIEKSQNLYDRLIKAGFPPQDCRYLLMHGQTTSCVYMVNIDKFISSFAFRCENNLSDEINYVYRLCLNKFKEKLIFDHVSKIIDTPTLWVYMELLRNADCLGANKKLGMNTDKVFGNSFARFPSANDEIKDITKNCDYDYTKSAWYLELQRINEELLFEGEKEMIDKWKTT